MTRQTFIFTDKFPQKIYRHIAFWFIYYLISLLIYFHPLLEQTTFAKWFVLEIVEVSWHVLGQIVFCYILLYWLLPAYFQTRRYMVFSLLISITAVLVTIGSYWGATVVFAKIHHYAGLPFFSLPALRWYAFISFISYYPISCGLVVAIKTLKNFYIKQTENKQLQRENANAELQLLKSQVHPHFLFNTLNNIYSFTLDNNQQAPALVRNLSDTLKYMLNECEGRHVRLSNEIKMITDYIEMEKIRYGKRLSFSVTREGDTDDKLIVPLLMIPFVENSFKHGASAMRGAVWISLHLLVAGDILYFTMSNSKPATAPRTANSGIGLNNVRKRLSLLYPGRDLLQMEVSDTTFTVKMQVPLESSRNTAGNIV